MWGPKKLADNFCSTAIPLINFFYYSYQWGDTGIFDLPLGKLANILNEDGWILKEKVISVLLLKDSEQKLIFKVYFELRISIFKL